MTQKVFFTSDTHFGHVVGLSVFHRNFSSIEEHDECLIENINRTVGKRDFLYHLGDFCWHSTDSLKIDFAKRILDQIVCTNIHLIMGNHDPKGKDGRLKPLFANQFESCQHYKVVRIPCASDDKKHMVVLSHYPIKSWESMHKGSFHLYGHCHATLPEDGTLSLDVGVDSVAFILGGNSLENYRPISSVEVCDLLDGMKIKTVDGHGLVITKE
jgi:calcineurin-like phosphoesterase family protein